MDTKIEAGSYNRILHFNKVSWPARTWLRLKNILLNKNSVLRKIKSKEYILPDFFFFLNEFLEQGTLVNRKQISGWLSGWRMSSKGELENIPRDGNVSHIVMVISWVYTFFSKLTEWHTWNVYNIFCLFFQ